MADDLPAIPGYTVFGEIGRGAAGVVYRAHQVSLDRPVALKVLHVGVPPDVRERFRAEAEAAARLRHPNIALVYDAGTCADRPYFAMEFLEGGTLARKLGGKPQMPTEAATVVEALARALQHTHVHGVVHRDLKPANILLAADGTPKVTDFGLARHSDAGMGTRTGDLVGTPSYMAPEQAAGRSHRAGPPGDVYALGAILYECLTGRPPFRCSTVVETLEQVLTQPVMPPREVVANLPADLEAVCLKCLCKEPVNRYPTAKDLADDLCRFLDGRTVCARPASRIGQVLPWCRRNPVATAVVTTLALYSVVVTYVWLRS